MKDRIQRFVALPFSLGCSTQSSVAVADTHDQPKKPDQLIKRREESDENGLFQKEDTSIDNNNNNGSANISDKIIRSFKSFSHYFIRYEEEREEREAEMEIGLPTDVKHLSHIGVDGTMTTFDVYSTTSSSSFPFAGFHLTAI
ncbi:PREDICTED: CRIB domain-containing protein RIC2 [Brassica oleracea var. oleracea]|uniref:CRIB domain-containing protein n=1 Tax=Brassica oleracea var. oleracea TaxID=109376 RepID=A0A0D3D6G8_BRAOL|nr:PREDICTED: CRIB domain-containing protein RIC2 [Brassica oleracea var. oleracea]